MNKLRDCTESRKGKAAVTTEGNEMQVAESVNAFQAFRPGWDAKSPTLIKSRATRHPEILTTDGFHSYLIGW